MPEVQPFHQPETAAAQRACANFLIDLDQCPSGQAPGGYWHALHNSEAWTSCEPAYAASLTALRLKWNVVLPCPPRPSQTSARSLLCHPVWSWLSMSLSLDLTWW